MSESQKPIQLSKMTPADAARIQAAAARENGGVVEKGSFAARAQRAAAKNNNK